MLGMEYTLLLHVCIGTVFALMVYTFALTWGLKDPFTDDDGNPITGMIGMVMLIALYPIFLFMFIFVFLGHVLAGLLRKG